MVLWADFLRNLRIAGDVFKTAAYLNDFCQFPDGSVDSQEAAEITNMLALRLVEKWFSQQPNNNDILPDLERPFYKSISIAAVLVALGANSGLSPDTIELESMLNQIADFSSGKLVHRKPN
jgi:hypothetical protein